MNAYKAMWVCLVTCGALLHVALTIPIDNGVKGYPKVTCGLHSIRVDVDTERPFQGRVYVKGESYNKDCIKSFAGSPPVAAPVPVPGPVPAPVPVPAYAPPPPPPASGYGETLFPRGVEYTFTLVVSFHPLFITKVDKAYRVRCFYMETEKTVAQQLEVSMLTTHQINEQFPMPQCRYHIKRGGPEGPYIRYARVGEPVHHVWECDAPAAWLYGILVKNCYVDDGQGHRVELIDERGCANDRHILPDLAYDQSLISAWVESHVFKYADKPHLYFTCTIVLCFKQDGGCNGITPPNCLGSPGVPKLPEPALPVPGPYPALPVKPPPPPVPYPPPPPPAPVPVPAYGPRPFAPYNRDAPPVKDERGLNGSADSQVDADTDEPATTETSDTTTISDTLGRRVADRLAKAGDARQKRQANVTDEPTTVKSIKGNRDLIETDLSAQTVIVLPFEEDEGSDDDKDLHETTRRALPSFKHSYAILPNVHGSGLPSGVCVSSSGFGILLALFLALFILSTTLTVFLVRRHTAFMNRKL